VAVGSGVAVFVAVGTRLGVIVGVEVDTSSLGTEFVGFDAAGDLGDGVQATRKRIITIPTTKSLEKL
jgi:hypothetical protein